MTQFFKLCIYASKHFFLILLLILYACFYESHVIMLSLFEILKSVKFPEQRMSDIARNDEEFIINF